MSIAKKILAQYKDNAVDYNAIIPHISDTTAKKISLDDVKLLAAFASQYVALEREDTSPGAGFHAGHFNVVSDQRNQLEKSYGKDLVGEFITVASKAADTGRSV